VLTCFVSLAVSQCAGHFCDGDHRAGVDSGGLNLIPNLAGACGVTEDKSRPYATHFLDKMLRSRRGNNIC
jgi:hypothetical protein